MDVFGFLGYINKFSLLAFIVTLGVLIFQVYQLKKDSKTHNENPVIPDFNENAAVPSLNYSPVNTKVEVEPSKNNNMNLIILIIVTVGVIMFLFFMIFMKNNNKIQIETKEEPLIKLTASKGIKIYDGKWSELDEAKIAALRGGEQVIVSIDKTSDPNIDKARIRVNKNTWDTNDEKVSFDKKTNLFYKQFTVATDSAYLKVEAQLHHTKDGWLGQ